MDVLRDLLQWAPLAGVVALVVRGASRTSGAVRTRLMIGGALLVGADMMGVIHGVLVPLYVHQGPQPGLMVVIAVLAILQAVLFPAGILLLVLAAIAAQRQRSAS